MKKLLIMSLMLAMVAAAVPAFAVGPQWWSGPFTTIMTEMTPTPTAGPTIIKTTYPRYEGFIYMGTIGDEVVEVTFCGKLGANLDDVEIDFLDLPQIATDHPKAPLFPEHLIVWGFGDPTATPATGFNDHTSGATGPAFFNATGFLLENSTDAITKIVLIGEVRGSGGNSFPYPYLISGGIASILKPVNTQPTCNGRVLP